MLKKYVILSLGLVFMLLSCDDVVYDPVVSVGGPITLSSPEAGNTVTMTDSTLSEIFATFDWTAAEFGFQAAVTYTLEMDLAGNSFAEPVNLVVASVLTLKDVTKERINNFALTRGLVGGESAALEFRVEASVNDDVASIFSNVVTINVVPVEATLATPTLNVPGAHQGWDPADGNTVIYARNFDTPEIYDGYMYFPADNTEFKYAKGGWEMNWGDDDADGTLDPDGANIIAPTTGMYYLNVDLDALTHTNELRSWGIIGTATPGAWDFDTDMTWDEDKQALTITMDMTTGGEYKFRVNDDWAVNLGDNDADGSLEQDGANIIVAEDGNYTIDLILNKEVYTYMVTKN